MNLEEFCNGKIITEADTKLIKRTKRSIEFEKHWRPNDLVFHYESTQEEWEKGMGSEGYMIVRDGQIIDTLVLKMN